MRKFRFELNQLVIHYDKEYGSDSELAGLYLGEVALRGSLNLTS